MSPTVARLYTRSAVPRLASGGAVLIGVIALVGWILDLPHLRSVLPGAVEMKANTALGLILAGFALFVVADATSSRARRGAQIAALGVAALGLATGSQYLFAWKLGIDELLFQDTGKAFNAIRGRMSPYSTAAFAALGIALACLSHASSRAMRALVWLLAAAVVGVGVVSALGYAWNAGELVTDRVLPPVAIHTAVAFILLGIGTLAVLRKARDLEREHAALSDSRIEARILTGFLGTLLLLVVSGGITYRSSVSFAEAMELVSRAQVVRTHLQRMLSQIETAESTHYLFLITGEPKVLEERDRLLRDLQQMQPTLTALVVDKAMARNVAELEKLIATRVALFDIGIAHYRQGGLDAFRRYFDTGVSRQAMDAIRSHVALMDEAEARLLAERETTAAGTRRTTLVALVVTLLVATLALALLFRGIRREIVARIEAQRFESRRREAMVSYSRSAGRGDAIVSTLELIAGFPPYVACAFYALDADQELLQRSATAGPFAAGPERCRRGEGPIARAGFAGGASTSAIEDLHDPAGAPASVACSVQYRGHSFGALVVVASRPPLASERAFLVQMAEQLGVALSDLRQFEDLRRLSAELQAKNETLFRQAFELEQASRMKSEFLATMSHELRTPLNAIIGFAEVLRDEVAGTITAEQREYVGDIYDSGEHLLALINDILDLSKVEAGKMDLSLEPVDVVSLLQNSLAMVRDKAFARRLDLRVDIPEDLPPAEVDARRVKQIVYNLLSNAVKFTPEGGAVTLRASLVAVGEGRELEISVGDTGIGIAAEDQARLFQPFVQIDGSIQKRFEGTGLGLAMVKRLAELHGGSVSLQSAVGKGSTFIVRLPYRTPDAAATVQLSAGTADRLPPRSRPLALVIEDEDKATALLRMQLEDAGLDVICTADGASALSLMRERQPDLVTLDVLLPGANGWDLLVDIRSDPALASIPVLVISIVAEERDGRALGAAGALQKPIDRSQLRAALVALGLANPTAQPITALVADDDPKAVEILAAFLQNAGCQVLRADGGLQAIALARAHVPDVMLLDLVTPVVSGFDVIDALKRDPTTASIPIIVVTAKVLSHDQRTALEGRVARILYKSEFRREQLLAEVRRAVASSPGD